MIETSKDWGYTDTPAALSMILVLIIIVSRGLYYGHTFLSSILVFISSLLYIPCFLWLFKRRNKNKSSKINFWLSLIIFVFAVDLYANIYYH